jgi:acetolactate synthase-1/2/3 large subunit
MHQERTYPGRVSGTRLTNPDFAMPVRSYGLHGETAEFADAFKRCEASGKPGLIEIRIDPEALTPKMSLTQIHEQALASGKGT